MPALSPTMTEGNIATWKVKEGDSFSAGDVLLEIETDKATMDVEAQDDGVMMKIMAQDGSKSVQVGSRIAVVAELGDDISSLQLPADESAKAPTQDKSNKAAGTSSSSPSDRSDAKPAGQSRGSAATATVRETRKQRYPLLPSVEHLVRQHGISEADVAKIRPTGPGGRLLKGDVLAYLGSINGDTPSAISSRFENLSHLDLSNVKVAPKKEKGTDPKETAADALPTAPVDDYVELHVPVSLDKVVDVQKRIQGTLNVFLPLSTFISRASEVANDQLPRPARTPTAADLFDQVLGLDQVKTAQSFRGVYLPQISAIPPASMLAPRQAPPRQPDLIDLLSAGTKQTKDKPQSIRGRPIPGAPGMSSGSNVFSLRVPREEEESALLFLQRCKAILEEEPGRLVL